MTRSASAIKKRIQFTTQLAFYFLCTLVTISPAWGRQRAYALNLDEKRARSATEGIQAWVDPEGYRKWVVSARAAFEALVDKEMSASATPK